VEEERRVITALWKDVEKQRRNLDYPPNKAEQHIKRYQRKDEPFSTPRDDLDGLFKDLPPLETST
jgi:hypothetical protein